MSYDATSLGFLPGGTASFGNGSNLNGSLIVGQAFDAGGFARGAYWDALNDIHELATLSGAFAGDSANDISDDSGVIYGVSQDGAGTVKPVMWSAPSYALSVLELPGGTVAGTVIGCSRNGRVAVGGCGAIGSPVGEITNPVPTVWIDGVPTQLPSAPSFPGYTIGYALDCSPDGSVVTGYLVNGIIGNTAQYIPVTWTGGPFWGANVLGTLSGGTTPVLLTNNAAVGSTTGGSLVVGFVGDASNITYAAFWNGLSLTTFPGPIGGAGSSASGCIASGTQVCGISASNEAALWISGIGSILPTFSGAQSVDYALIFSSDATTIVGGGTDSEGRLVAVKWTTSVPPPPPPGTGHTTFLVCGNDWTISQPKTQLYGLDHLIGQLVVGLADGTPIGPLFVQLDGSVALPFPASFVTLGRSFSVQLQTPYLDIGNPTVQGRRKDITAVTVRVDASAAPFTGTNQPDGGSFTPTQVDPPWTNMQPSVTQDPPQFPTTYVGPSGQTVTQLFSGDFRANLQPGWDERGQVAVQQTLPLPLAVVAIVPEVLQGDLPEQTYAPQPGGQGEGRGPGPWMLTSRGRR